MLPIEHQNYAVMLRDKTAEFGALKALDAPNRGFILPIFVAASFFVKRSGEKAAAYKERVLGYASWPYG